MANLPKDFVERNAWRGALAIIRDWGAIIAIAVTSYTIGGPIVYLIAVWLIGAFQFALTEALLHEASHYNLFPQKKWNDRAEILLGLPFFRTVKQFRIEHRLHHAKLGQPDDPIIVDYKAHGLLNGPINLTWIWFIKPFIGYAGYYYCRALSLSPRKEGLKILTFWTIVLFIVFEVGIFKLILLYWIIPFFWCCMSFLYWSEITDHYLAKNGTRSNLSPVKNFLHHNNGYHYIHHKYANIPWYRLPDAARSIAPDGGEVCYSFLDTYKCLRRAASFIQIQ
ncbi:fatty acid desaturase family protein [Nitrospirillum sp. BR 11828]|uniref:fatty acid desaturase family protein n=1 Tax=Nitrospirillum sp. BR 11828 TaxID=3104325 RepID=UPI002ACA5B47|nr:fatty acid desaturase [Nitrospirillum sp. BR 11828]MDZ5649363.1 fatty acid desaturase [Nitrospirillum sp. BR 11828]